MNITTIQTRKPSKVGMVQVGQKYRVLAHHSRHSVDLYKIRLDDSRSIYVTLGESGFGCFKPVMRAVG